MIAVMILFFLLQVFQRFTKHISDNASAGYQKQKVRHGFHLPSVRIRGGKVSSPCCACRLADGKDYTMFFMLAARMEPFVTKFLLSRTFFSRIIKIVIFNEEKLRG